MDFLQDTLNFVFGPIYSDLVAVSVLVYVAFIRATAASGSLQPVKTAHRRLQKTFPKPNLDRDDHTLIRDELLESLKKRAESIRPPEIAQVCSSIRIAILKDRDNPASAPPYECRIVMYLHLLVAEALEPRSLNIITRFLRWARWEDHQAFLHEIDQYLKQFSALSPVAALYPNTESAAEGGTNKNNRSEPDPNFAEIISASTGAIILADLTTRTASLSTTSIAVWHERAWLGGQGEHANGAERSGVTPAPRFDGIQHLPDSLTTPYEIASRYSRKELTARSARLDRFNGRIPVLLRAEDTQSLGLEEPILLLVTGETDYNSTEERNDDGSYGTRACKKLPALPDNVEISHYAPIKRGGRFFSGSESSIYHLLNPTFLNEGISASNSAESREALRKARVLMPENATRAYQLNGKVTFISRSVCTAGDNEEKSFHTHAILMNRSMTNENGFGIATTTAGGALSLSVPRGRVDGNEFGALDVMSGIEREVTEELGLDTSEYSMAVHAVVQHNSRPDPSISRPLTPDNGEMTSTCLAIAHTALTPDQLNAKRFTGSASMGLAEADGLIAIPLAGDADEFYTTITRGHYCTRCSQFWPDHRIPPDTDCIAGEPHATQLLRDNVEQMALVSLAYCSSIIHGVKNTKKAWHSTPLWAEPFTLDGTRYSRVCVHPSRLYASERFSTIVKKTFANVEDFDNFGSLNGRSLL